MVIDPLDYELMLSKNNILSILKEFFTIPKTQLKKLHKELIKVLLLSIEKGGSTDRNYVNAEGKKGSYIDFAQVFRREKLPCITCGREIIKTKLVGRGTHICTHCQKLYK